VRKTDFSGHFGPKFWENPKIGQIEKLKNENDRLNELNNFSSDTFGGKNNPDPFLAEKLTKMPFLQ
jgi:hypothetical protein